MGRSQTKEAAGDGREETRQEKKERAGKGRRREERERRKMKDWMMKERKRNQSQRAFREDKKGGVARAVDRYGITI